MSARRCSGGRPPIRRSTAASGAIWYRHLVRHLGNDSKRIQRIVGGADTPGVPSQVAPFPAHVSAAPPGRSLTDLLVASEIDAFFTPLPPQRYAQPDGAIVRMIPDFTTVEQDYFAKTQCYPPQHAIVIRRAVWERDPSLGRRLVETCNACDRQFQAVQKLYPYHSPWLMADVEAAGYGGRVLRRVRGGGEAGVMPSTWRRARPVTRTGGRVRIERVNVRRT